MNFNIKLQALRKEKNITQEELAEKLNVSRQAVSKWESGQTMPDIENIIELSNIFSVPIDSLLKDDFEQCAHKNTEKEIGNSTNKTKLLITGLTVYTGILGLIVLFMISIIKDTPFSRLIIDTRNSSFFILLLIFCAMIIGGILYYLNVKKYLNLLKTGIILLGLCLLFEILIFIPFIFYVFKYKTNFVFTSYHNNISLISAFCFTILAILGFYIIFRSKKLHKIKFGVLIFISGLALSNFIYIYILPILIDNINYKSSYYKFARTLYNNQTLIIVGGFLFLTFISIIIQIIINLYLKKRMHLCK